MVDFQSRDRRRDDDDDGEPEQDDRGSGQGDHDHHDHDADELGVAVVTVSTSRTAGDDDPSGDAIDTAFEAAGHEVVSRELVDDDRDSIQGVLDRAVGRTEVDIVVTTGGTGVTPDDVTVEVVEPLFGKALPGFGELFRLLSYEEVGTRVVGTRATAGVVEGVPVFCLPGSENAARLGTEKIIVPEAGHLVGLARRE